jgi:hypothetical protein
MKSEYIDKCRSLVDIADELKIYYGTVAEYCRLHEFDIRQRSNYSLEEIQISNFLTGLNIKHECGNWSILQNKELDIYISEYKLAIEINGLYWHSYNPSQQKQENKKQHIEKTIACELLGIELLHITDWEWHNKTEIIKNLIKSKLKLNNSIGARKCCCEVITNKVAGKFLDSYHLQGHTSAYKSYALTFEDDIKLVITIGKSRFNKQYQFELLRLCGLSGVTISGGISKLIKFIKKDLNIPELMTYCDRSKSTGAGYKAAGFKFTMYTGPGYFWTDGNNIISRYKSQKHNLHKILLNFDQTLSESENMFANKYRRFWDCGNIVFTV